MKLDENYSYSKKKIFFISFLFISVTFILFNLIYCPKYPVNDDIIMMMISSGYFTGVPDEHIVFSSFLIGLILKFLYINILNINWYSWYLTFINLSSCFILLYSFLKIRQSIKTVIAFLLVYLFILKDFCFFIQFSHTATLVTLSGLILYLSTLHSQKWVVFDRFLALVMIVIGSQIRFEGAILIIVLFGPYLFYYIFKKKAYNLIIFLGLAIALMAIFKVANQYYYKKDKEWAYYNKLNLKWGLILNNPKYQLIDKNSNTFSDIGWSLNDREVFFNYWILEDSSNYSLTKLNYLFSKNNVTYSQIKYGRGNFKIWVSNQLWTLHLLREKYLINRPDFWLIKLFKGIIYFTDSYYNSFLLLSSAFLMMFFISKGMRIDYFLSLILLILLIGLFNATNSILFKPRILNSMMLTTFCLGIFHNQINTVSEKQLNKSKYILLSLYFLLVLSFSSLYITLSSISNKKINIDQQVIWSEIDNSFPNQPILILDGSNGFSTNNINPFNNEYNLKATVKYYYSSWLSQSPINKRIIDNLNSRDFFSSLIDGKILIYNQSKDLSIFKPIIIYFNEHFNKNVVIKALNVQKTIYRVSELRNN